MPHHLRFFFRSGDIINFLEANLFIPTFLNIIYIGGTRPFAVTPLFLYQPVADCKQSTHSDGELQRTCIYTTYLLYLLANTTYYSNYRLTLINVCVIIQYYVIISKLHGLSTSLWFFVNKYASIFLNVCTYLSRGKW